MNAENKPVSEDALVEWVHEAFAHLYDSRELQESPLARFLAGHIPDPVLRSQEVRRMILEAIHSIRPEASVPAGSSDWRSYRLMELRYIKGLNPVEAMAQLSLSKSQFFREQAAALKQVAQVLWERHRPADAAGSRETLAHSEAERLLQSAVWEAVDLGRLVADLMPVVEPLARVKQVKVSFSGLEEIIIPRADRVMLRQAVLNIVTYAMDLAARGRLDLQGFRAGEAQGLRISAAGGADEASGRTGVGLEVDRRLIGEMGGEMQVDDRRPSGWQADLIWRPVAPKRMLVVDDNLEFADLFRRYLAVRGWEVIGASDGESARAEILQRRPTVILLDVMMPREDGWEFLMEIKSRSETREIPVLVCSVLSEPQLAATLGAEAYLTKPVTRQALLQALAPWDSAESAPAPGRAEPPAQSEKPPM